MNGDSLNLHAILWKEEFTLDKMKVVGIAATVIGLGASLLSDWVSDKKTDKEITEKVNEAVKALKESD